MPNEPRLSFNRGASWEELRDAASQIVDELGITPAPWRRTEHQTLVDKQHMGQAFGSVWARPGAELEEVVESGSGNPRDGYGYDMRWTLVAKLGTRTLLVNLSDSAWDPRPRALSFTFKGFEPRELEASKTVLRAWVAATPSPTT